MALRQRRNRLARHGASNLATLHRWRIARVIGAFFLFYLTVAPIHFYVESGKYYVSNGSEIGSALVHPLADGVLYLIVIAILVELCVRLFSYPQPASVTPAANPILTSIFIILVVDFIFFGLFLYVLGSGKRKEFASMIEWSQIIAALAAVVIAFITHRAIVHHEMANE